MRMMTATRCYARFIEGKSASQSGHIWAEEFAPFNRSPKKGNFWGARYLGWCKISSLRKGNMICPSWVVVLM